MSAHAPLDGSLYGEVALSQACRILGFADRDAASPTYGCCERTYWHYRQVDFVNARFQEAALFLALLYHYSSLSNRFYQQAAVREWAEAAVRFWATIERSDGSFDEYWPFERSFVATAFSLAAVAETCQLLHLDPPEAAIRPACHWLGKQENLLVLNQMAGASVALALSGALLNDDEIRRLGERKMQRLLERQHPDGYFAEYGGYDIGYLTINLSYLGKYFLLTHDNAVMEAMRRTARFLEDKILEYGTYDYHATSRKTQYIYPFGLRVLEEWDLLQRHLTGLARNEVLNPSWMDDRYCIPLAIDYLQAAMYPISL